MAEKGSLGDWFIESETEIFNQYPKLLDCLPLKTIKKLQDHVLKIKKNKECQ